jgi:hypothetical protein
MLTAEYVREIFNYCELTGSIYRKKPSCGIKAGQQAGYIDAGGYRSMSIKNKNYFAHRVIWLFVYGELPSGEIDHIDGDKLNNRISNLRNVTHQTNVENVRYARSHNKSSGVLGVTWSSHAKKWYARTTVKGKIVYLGYHDSKEAANAAYLKAKRELHSGCTI